MKNKFKQISAIIAIVILVMLYILLVVFAIFDFPGRERLFYTCLYATIAVPILTWIYIFLYGKMKDHHTIASPDIMSSSCSKKEKKNTDNQSENDSDSN